MDQFNLTKARSYIIEFYKFLPNNLDRLRNNTALRNQFIEDILKPFFVNSIANGLFMEKEFREFFSKWLSQNSEIKISLIETFPAWEGAIEPWQVAIVHLLRSNGEVINLKHITPKQEEVTSEKFYEKISAFDYSYLIGIIANYNIFIAEYNRSAKVGHYDISMSLEDQIENDHLLRDLVINKFSNLQLWSIPKWKEYLSLSAGSNESLGSKGYILGYTAFDYIKDSLRFEKSKSAIKLKREDIQFPQIPGDKKVLGLLIPNELSTLIWPNVGISKNLTMHATIFYIDGTWKSIYIQANRGTQYNEVNATYELGQLIEGSVGIVLDNNIGTHGEYYDPSLEF